MCNSLVYLFVLYINIYIIKVYLKKDNSENVHTFTSFDYIPINQDMSPKSTSMPSDTPTHLGVQHCQTVSFVKHLHFYRIFYHFNSLPHSSTNRNPLFLLSGNYAKNKTHTSASAEAFWYNFQSFLSKCPFLIFSKIFYSPIWIKLICYEIKFS